MCLELAHGEHHVHFIEYSGHRKLRFGSVYPFCCGILQEIAPDCPFLDADILDSAVFPAETGVVKARGITYVDLGGSVFLKDTDYGPHDLRMGGNAVLGLGI